MLFSAPCVYQILLILSDCFPQRYKVVLRPCANQYPTEYLRGTLCRSPEFSLCKALSSLIHYPTILATLISWNQVHLFNSGYWFSLSSSTWKIKAVSFGNYKTHLACVLSLRNHCSSLPDVQYLKNGCFRHFVRIFHYFRQEVKFAPYYF